MSKQIENRLSKSHLSNSLQIQYNSHSDINTSRKRLKKCLYTMDSFFTKLTKLFSFLLYFRGQLSAQVEMRNRSFPGAIFACPDLQTAKRHAGAGRYPLHTRTHYHGGSHDAKSNLNFSSKR